MTGNEQKSISILHTNDMHGSYMPFLTTTDNATAQTGDAGRDTLITFDKAARIGGFAYLASAVKKVRTEKGADNVLLVDGGDTFSDDLLGNLTKGEAMIPPGLPKQSLRDPRDQHFRKIVCPVPLTLSNWK